MRPIEQGGDDDRDAISVRWTLGWAVPIGLLLGLVFGLITGAG